MYEKILLLIPALNAGGAERVIVTLANEWSKQNDVTLLLFNNGISFYYLESRVHVKYMNLMPKKGKIVRKLSILVIEWKRFTYIYDEIKSGQYDFILSFCWTTNIFASFVSMLQKEKKVIVSERADLTKYPKWLKFLIYHFYKRNTAIICQNKMTRDYFQKWKFENNLLVLPNPVNFADIPSERCPSFRKEIVAVGRLCKQKNHKLLIDAFSEISEQYPEYSLKIFGVGELEKEILDHIRNLGLINKVKLMGVRKKIMFEVNSSAIFVLSSDSEGFPNALIEAMAVGMPVISSRFATGVAEELIIEGENGYLFNVGDKDGLVCALRKILARENEFLNFAAKNRKIAEQYRDSVVAEKWLNAIDNL